MNATEEAKHVPRGIRRSRRGRFESAMPGATKATLLHLDHDLVAALDAQAAAAGETRSVVVRKLLRIALKGREGAEQGAGGQSDPATELGDAPLFSSSPRKFRF